MGEVVLIVDDWKSGSATATSSCGICHEEEFESCKSLEAPCACFGTVKFAHRDCIQMWCNGKGITICEICLQREAREDRKRSNYWGMLLRMVHQAPVRY